MAELEWPTWALSSAACLVVTLVCQLLVGGLYLLLRFQKQLATYAEISVMGLGVGTMVADAMMHLIPHAAAGGGHDHHHHGSGGDDHFWSHLDGVLLGLSAIGGMVFVVMLEMFVHSVQHGDHGHASSKKRESHRCSLSVREMRNSLNPKTADHGSTNSGGSGGAVKPLTPRETESLEECLHNHSEVECEAHHHHHHGFAHLFDESDETRPPQEESNALLDPLGRSKGGAPTHRASVASTSRLGDNRGGRMFAASLVYVAAKIVHDMIDGFTIGIAFNSGFSTGLATSVCILAHELPMQFADYVILRKGGFRPLAAGGINLIVSLFLVPGALLAGLGKSKTLTRHLLMATAGNFLCLAFSQLLPEIRETLLDLEGKGSSRKFLGCAIVSAFLGVVCIAILGVFEGLA